MSARQSQGCNRKKSQIAFQVDKEGDCVVFEIVIIRLSLLLMTAVQLRHLLDQIGVIGHSGRLDYWLG